MASESAILDATTRHQIFIQRYAAGREAEVQEFVENLLNEIVVLLSGDVTEFGRARLEALLMDIRALSNEAYAQLGEQMIQEAMDFVEYEAEFTAKMIEDRIVGSMVLPNTNQLYSAIFTNIMDLEPTRGYSIRDALAVFGTKKSQQIVQGIRDGIVIGETNEQIRKRVSDLKSLQKNQGSSVVRTITNHVAVQARDVTLRENEDIFEGYEWVATLDSRTSFICMSRDGIVYPFGDNPETSPKPPAHFSCRSTIVPKIKPEFDLEGVTGVRPAKGSSGTTQVDSKTTYERWLRRQSAGFIDEVLGPSRGQLFRKGNLSIGRFVDDQGRTLTLDELRQMEPLAFEGLDL